MESKTLEEGADNIFAYAKRERDNYRTQPIDITDRFSWNMFEHVENSLNMRESVYWKGETGYGRPYKNTPVIE